MIAGGVDGDEIKGYYWNNTWIVDNSIVNGYWMYH